MKTAMVLAAAVAMTGCATGGLFSKLQSTDDALAARYGIPVSVVGQVRSTLGIPDARTLPDSSRVLPVGWSYVFDLRDDKGVVVDQSRFHWDTTPRLVPSGANAVSVLPTAPGSAPSGTATLENLIQLIQSNPTLLQPAK